jgi:hypothetical protein
MKCNQSLLGWREEGRADPRAWNRRSDVRPACRESEEIGRGSGRREDHRAWSHHQVTALAGPASCYLINEGVVIALADDADGMAVVREDQVVRI